MIAHCTYVGGPYDGRIDAVEIAPGWANEEMGYTPPFRRTVHVLSGFLPIAPSRKNLRPTRVDYVATDWEMLPDGRVLMTLEPLSLCRFSGGRMDEDGYRHIELWERVVVAS